MGDRAAFEVRHLSPEVVESLRGEGDRLLQARLVPAACLFDELGAAAVSNVWHIESAWKRALATLVYGDLLEDGPRLRVLEVGGGLSGITLALVRAHEYRLVELATRGDAEEYERVERHLGRGFVTIGDWGDLLAPAQQDVVVANDLFPNVDQRVHVFLDRYLPLTRELRLVLTYYEDTVWRVQRADSGETLTIKPWGLAEVTRLLDGLEDEFGPYDRTQVVYRSYEGTLFRNRRNVLYVRLRH